MKKKILFSAPNHFNIYKMIIKNLEFCGFEVFFLEAIDSSFKYKNLKDKLINLFRKTFLNDKNYKKVFLRNKYNTETHNKKLILFENNHFDYSLTIRADLFSEQIIDRICSISKKNIAYQWDGINRYPLINKLISKFDKFYVFEKADYKIVSQAYSNIHLTNNFFPTVTKHHTPVKSDVFYIGTYSPDRFTGLLNFYKKLKTYNLDLNILINTTDENVVSNDSHTGLKFITSSYSYEDTLAFVEGSKVVLDFKVPHHSGLSFRFFEALKYKSKIITDNTSVKDYDFYSPENVFIIGIDTDLEVFIKSPYAEIPKNLVEKYSFNNWIKELLK